MNNDRNNKDKRNKETLEQGQSEEQEGQRDQQNQIKKEQEEWEQEQGALPDDWFDDDEEEDEDIPPPLLQRKGFRRIIAFVFSLALVANILAFWPQVYSLAAIQFLVKSSELSQNEDIQQYKESIVTIRTEDGKGTGFAVTEDGIIITNHHVIEGGLQIRVIFPTGDGYIADVLVSDPVRDIAVLHINAQGLPVLPLSEGNEDATDESIYVIGNPLFFNHIANEGHVAGYLQRDEGELLLIDAPIYKGNSGSPIINEQGEVIGVVFATSRVDIQGKATRVGLAVPIEDVHRHLEDLDIEIP
ncbi:S1C family serine protease [Bacillus horti]|uniref:Serine protease Do n=1 Tax=Caldalkalibacillus horti TaxID=77523 RepID=A0ABT9VVA8_9BACI|nr:serine protease [Bacillus horti]MDQ0164922.1 serine protease Do [Bacillus horti]